MNDTSTSPARRNDLDWLRVLLIALVFVFHSLRFFDIDGWHIKNANTYSGLQMLVTFLSRWMMPAIFVVSGMSVFYALGKRNAGRFVKDRAARLLVPLLVGLFSHIILQGYLEKIRQSAYTGTFWQYYASRFDGLMYLGGNFNWIGNHLWYLEVLFVFSLVCLPVFIWLRRGSGSRVLAWLGEALAKPGALLLLAVPTYLFQVLLNPAHNWLITSDDFGGWSLPCHLIFFLAGFILAASTKTQARLRSWRWVWLAAGLVTFLAGGTFLLVFGDPLFGSQRFYVIQVFNILTAWTWVWAILGFGMQSLNRRSPVLDYANEAVMPVYVLHQTVLLSVGFFVLRWPIPDLLKWAIILAGSFAIVMGLY